MRILYLASCSAQRKKLLQERGLRFKVIPVKVKEKRRLSGRLSWVGLAKANALAKAKAARRSVRHGLIIGADTIVVQDGKIFGKPKDLKELERMLLRLSFRPHWVYTGVAVIDVDANKTLLACERTRIEMDRLSRQEIQRCFSKNPLLDKAGGLDIQSQGAFFIKRIDGCFYNVVGLPLRRLRILLKRLGVDISSLFFLMFTVTTGLFLSGCSTEYNLATRQQEVYFYSTDKEVSIGQAIDREIMRKYKLVDDPLVQTRVEDIGKRIVAVCDRKEIDYHFKVLQNDEVNAVAMPGGFIYIFSGLIEKIENDDQLAAVLAHEVAHIVARHNIKRLQALMGYSLFQTALLVASGRTEAAITADAIFTQLLLGYSREDELLADQLAARYLKLAGFNPHAMIGFLDRLQQIDRKRPLQPKNYFKTHPYISDRKRVVKMELGESIDFSDYINMMDRPHE